MSLFKIYKGAEADLPKSYTEGYAYFCSDTGNMYIDTDGTSDGRVQVNADVATALVQWNSDGTIAETLNFDDIVTTSDTIAIAHGGTGAITASAARTNLSVYSKSETDAEVDEATSVAYTATLAAANWVSSSGVYTYTYSNTSLSCGKNHDVPPIVTYTSNQDEFLKITDAQATAGTGIVFTAEEAISSAIGILIIDIK